MNKKHAYLIMAHGDWSLLSKLLMLLDDIRNDIYVHIDRKVTFDEKDVYYPKLAGIKYVRRINVSWGGDSLIKCEMELLKAAVGGQYAYYHLLSGQDLPIKSQEEIHCFFSKHPKNNYIKIDSRAMKDGYPLKRICNYYFFQNMISRRSGHWIGLLYWLNEISFYFQKLLGIDRLKKCSKKIYKGTNWFSITHEMVLLLLQEEDFIKRYCYYSLCADEIFLQTIAMNSYLADTIVDDDLRLIDWERGNPYIFSRSDYDMIMNSQCLFARKFSDYMDSEITRKIVETIL